MNINILKNKTTVARYFSDYLVALINDRETFHVALSGGSTPKVIFDLLAAEYSEIIDWSKIHFYWGDERCVAPTDTQSNYKMTVGHLFSKINVPKTNIHRIKGEDEPTTEAKRYSDILSKQLNNVEGLPQFDLVILGMGDDGHTASIFPHEIDLWSAEKPCVVATHPESGQKRISITGNMINAAANVAFLVTGENKAEKIDHIINQKDGYQQFPASLVNPKSGDLTWFLDEAAASLIS